MPEPPEPEVVPAPAVAPTAPSEPVTHVAPADVEAAVVEQAKTIAPVETVETSKPKPDVPLTLSNFPITMVDLLSGYGALTLMYKKLSEAFPTSGTIGFYCCFFSFVVWFSGLFITYGLKALQHPSCVMKEWNHADRTHYFSSLAQGFLMLAISLLDDSHKGIETIGRVLFWIGFVIQTFMALGIFGAWIERGVPREQWNPTFFVPIYGNLFVAWGASMLQYYELSWFYFSSGAILSMVVFTMNLSRLMLDGMLPRDMIPSLMHFVAPTSLLALSYMSMTRSFDGFARCLYTFSMVMWLVLTRCWGTFRESYHRDGWQLSWAAFTFPVAMCAASVIEYQRYIDSVFTTIVAIFAAVYATVAVVMLETILTNPMLKKKMKVRAD